MKKERLSEEFIKAVQEDREQVINLLTIASQRAGLLAVIANIFNPSVKDLRQARANTMASMVKIIIEDGYSVTDFPEMMTMMEVKGWAEQERLVIEAEELTDKPATDEPPTTPGAEETEDGDDFRW